MSPSNSAGPGNDGRQSYSVPSIPLTDANAGANGEPTIGNLVKEATASASTLFRSEVALAKAEIVTEAKKAGTGTGLLVVAGLMLLYSSFFFFFFLAELLSEWLPRWAAFGIVFLLLLLISAAAGFIGYVVFRRLHPPQKTIDSLTETRTVLTNTFAGGAPETAHPGIPPARDLQRD
ncbi:phage holin family protein [Gordonia sp. TBRC 11910]|uniref:Phage holin family protein n=1 Tax=Gordonia asplenii TaxID=2725283 RepID=A0A848L6C5_9ACTN|nr:phage holin family protein [Gordonia asplenii]NMO03158.1 phage holin family protein [Gordonia asplenii]